VSDSLAGGRTKGHRGMVLKSDRLMDGSVEAFISRA
jgi:hypothetical protein